MCMNGYVINIQATQKVPSMVTMICIWYLSNTSSKHKLSHCSSEHDDKYMQTMHSVMTKLKKVAGKSMPKNDVEFVSKKAGGVLSALSAGPLPCGRQQVKDMRYASSLDVDLLYSVMMMCKQSEGRRNMEVHLSVKSMLRHIQWYV